MHPKVSWYRLPAFFQSQRDHYLAQNDGYTYKNYIEIFGKFVLRRKDLVPHPLWSKTSK
jgi:fatty acid desaturase